MNSYTAVFVRLHHHNKSTRVLTAVVRLVHYYIRYYIRYYDRAYVEGK